MFSRNALKQYYSNAEFKKFPGNNGLPFIGEEILFPFSGNVPKLSYSNADFQNFPGDNTLNSTLGARKICFRSPKIYWNSPTAMQNSKIFPGAIPRIPVFGVGKFVFVLWKFSKTLLYSNAEFTNSPGTIPRTPVLRERGKYVSVLRKCTKTLLSAIPNSKIFPGTIPRTFDLGAGKFVFVLQKFIKTLLYSMQNSQILRGPPF